MSETLSIVILFTFQGNLAKFSFYERMSRVDGCLSISGLCGSTPAQKIRGESSSNGSECGVPVSLRTKIRAELSSNGSWRSRRALEPMDAGSL